VANVHLSAVEHKDQIVFMHHVESGPAAKSYGIQVASLAGVPKPVLATAKKYLQHLEEGSEKQAKLDLFSIDTAVSDEYPSLLSPNEEAVLNKLKQVDPNDLTAKQALDLLYELQQKLR
jgi:DNA mismatch repair protein MutS